MKISYRWLTELVATPTVPDILGEKFRMTSSEVEGIENYGPYTNIVTGYINSVTKHPDAERLQIANVQVGKKQYTIVTNAANVREHMTCIVALEGALVVMGEERVTITPTKLRGVLSEGMFCSLSELGLPNPGDTGGIWLSNDETIPQGISVDEALQLSDSVLNLEITPNRPDLLSYRGLAREVGAFEHRDLKIPVCERIVTSEKKSEAIRISIDDHKLCTHYAAIRVEGNLTKPSPWWIQRRLLVSGIRPISAIVDVTNYVLLEMGQPLHAFAVDKKKAVEFRVRSAHKSEKITLLDETNHILEEGDIIVADKENRPIDLAGIMGGKGSSITDGTTSALLESACFHGPSIRRTSRRLGVRSEASTRFEKGVDSENVVPALERALQLLKEIGEIEIVSELFDSATKSIPLPRIHVTYAGIQQILGVHISAQECKSILQRLGFQIQNMNKSGFYTIPPSWRKDVRLTEDVVEELIRIWGYDRIPITTLSGAVKTPQPNTHFETLYSFRTTLAALGAYECITPPFVSQKQIEQCGLTITEAIKLPNPLSTEHAYLTPSHLIGFLANITTQNNNEEELSLFEISNTFHTPAKEVEKLSILIRSNHNLEVVVRKAKQYVESMVTTVTWKTTTTGAVAMYGNKELGSFTVLSENILSAHKIRRAKSIVFLEFTTNALVSAKNTSKYYKPLPQYPSIERDVTLVLSEATPISAVEAALSTYSVINLISTSLTTLYRGKPLENDQKAVTIHFTYNAQDRTLTDEEVTKEHQKIIDHCRTTLNASIND